ncbi:MAG: RecQ family ATP-dependent DNA helicase [Muribaculaceae bacterium]|nr:RecQ family ATP-dependent DNA helicase [Muribaculaceae bacterium]
MRQTIKDILQDYWGYTDFRPLQEDIIMSVLEGRDTLGLLPTGGGKSITFQVPALALEGITVVITPLISLMKDQVDNLRAIGIKAIYMHSGLTRAENRLAFDRCRLGKVKLLYISPEKLQSKTFIDQLRLFDISLIVVDEAHCISQWGYDFRPSYLKISSIRTLFPKAPVLALTASATPEVVDGIMARLNFNGRNVFARSFTRENLSYIVRYGDHKESLLLKVLENTAGSSIVYVRSRRRTREIADILIKHGISADFYHAGLAPEDKDEKQNRWKADQCRVMVATNAFGMGIDKPDVRVVVHHDLPSSLEEYYQEAGRAGRDGKPAFAVLLAAKHDKGTLTRRISENFPDKEFIKRTYELAGNFLNVAVGSGYNEVYEFNFNLFCKRFELQPVSANSALNLLSQAGYIDFTEEISTRSRVMVLLHKDELYSLRLQPQTDQVFQLLLRTYSGLFADYVYINEALLASRLNTSEEVIYQALLDLTRNHVTHYIPRKTTPYILYTTSRELPKYITLPHSVYEEQRERLEHRIEAMKQFAFDTEQCRVNTMLRYFGENPHKECGTCDVCRSRRHNPDNKQQQEQIAESIIYIVSQPGTHTIKGIASTLSKREEDIVGPLRQLADQGIIAITAGTVTLTDKP